jgi:TRAP-type uncharacterized transport system substrate-binding protein
MLDSGRRENAMSFTGKFTVGLGLAVAAVTAATLVALPRLLPPRSIVMATGPQGGTYAELGPRYRDALARAGVEVRLLTTAGGVENLARLRDPRSGVSVGFVSAGFADPTDSTTLASLGTAFFEPLWLFYRGPGRATLIQDLPGRRLSLGPEGSTSRVLGLRLLSLEGAEDSRFDLLSLTPEEAAEQLVRREIDAAEFVTSFDSSVVRRLIADPAIVLASLPRADALIALHPYLEKLVLPQGVGDLARNLPPADTVLLSTRANLVVRRDLDPALQYVLLEAAAEIHGGPGVFHRGGRFPAPEAADLPLSEAARQYYKSGPPWLQRHLPLGIAVLGERLLLLLIPLAGLVYPVMRFLPALYDWSQRRRLFRLYRELKSLEAEVESGKAGEGDAAVLRRLDALDSRANRLRVPPSVSPSLYTFRSHLDLVRDRLRARVDAGRGEER